MLKAMSRDIKQQGRCAGQRQRKRNLEVYFHVLQGNSTQISAVLCYKDLNYLRNNGYGKNIRFLNGIFINWSKNIEITNLTTKMCSPYFYGVIVAVYAWSFADLIRLRSKGYTFSCPLMEGR